MRPSLLLATVLLATALPPGARAGDEPDRERLRKVLHFPEISVNFGYVIRENGEVVESGWEPPIPDWEGEIRRLRGTLAGKDTDAENLAQLAEILRKAKRDPEARECDAKARVMFQRRVETGGKEYGLLLGYGKVLARRGDDALAEAILLRAVEAGPDRWEACVELGRILTSRAIWTAFSRRVDEFDELQSLMAGPGPGPVKPEAGAAALRMLGDAGTWHDRAVKSAPKETGPLLARGHFRMMRALCLPNLPGATPLDAREELGSWWGDLRLAADLRPGDVRAAALSTMITLFALAGRNGEMAGTPSSPLFTGKAREKALGSALEFEKLGETGPSSSTAVAYEVAGILRMLCDQADEALARLRKAVELDPGREMSWKLLLRMCGERKERPLMEEISTRWLKLGDTADRRILVAKKWDQIGDPVKAEENVRAALKLDAAHLNGNLGLACLLLRAPCEGARAEELARAMEASRRGLDNLRYGENGNADLYRNCWVEYMLLRSVSCGLEGDLAQAEEGARRLLKYDGDNADAREVLNALKRGAEPPRDK